MRRAFKVGERREGELKTPGNRVLMLQPFQALPGPLSLTML